MKLLYGIDVIEGLKTLADESVDCVVTSPPYWSLRDYGIKGQLGLEKTPELFVHKMVAVFSEVRRVLKDKGTLWMNLGDTYNSSRSGARDNERWPKQSRNEHSKNNKIICRQIKPKELVGIPWRVAFALQADGWYLRQDIIWSKPNPMPESVTDRCTKSHEYIFLLTKSQKYYYDSDAIKEPFQDATYQRMMRGVSDKHKNINGAPGQSPQSFLKARPNQRIPSGWDTSKGGHSDLKGRFSDNRKKYKPNDGGGTSFKGHSGYKKQDGTLIGDGMRNKRSVWEISTQPYPKAHFATFPMELPKICIMAGCPMGGIVLDPFSGSGTTGEVAIGCGRDYIGIDINKEYEVLARDRLGLFA